MDFLPVCLDLKARECLIAGGNSAAARKAQLLLRAQARITVVASRLCPALQLLHNRAQLTHVQPPPSRQLLAAQHLVIVADPDPDNGLPLAELARRLRIPVNVVDHPALCSFIMPALIDRSPIIVAVTSGGAAPVLIRQLRGRIEQLMPEGLGRLAALVGSVRERVREILPETTSRRHFWEYWLRTPSAQQIVTDPSHDPAQAAEQVIEQASKSRVSNRLYLLTGMPGIPDQMTLGAIRLLAEADVVIHERHTPRAILDYGRRDADYIDADAMRSLDDVAGWVAGGLLVVWLSSGALAREKAALGECGVPHLHYQPGATN